MGTLIDFGGATEAGEGPKQTAAREFAEETLGCFFYSDEYQEYIILYYIIIQTIIISYII